MWRKSKLGFYKGSRPKTRWFVCKRLGDAWPCGAFDNRIGAKWQWIRVWIVTMITWIRSCYFVKVYLSCCKEHAWVKQQHWLSISDPFMIPIGCCQAQNYSQSIFGESGYSQNISPYPKSFLYPHPHPPTHPFPSDAVVSMPNPSTPSVSISIGRKWIDFPHSIICSLPEREGPDLGRRGWPRPYLTPLPPPSTTSLPSTRKGTESLWSNRVSSPASLVLIDEWRRR